MSESRFYVKPLGPAAIIENFVAAINEFAPGTRVKGISVGTPHGSIPVIGANTPVSDIPTNESYKKALESLRSADFLQVHSVNVVIAESWTLTYNNSEADPFINLRLDMPGQEPELLDRAVKIGSALQHHFPLIHKAERGSLRLPPEQLEAFKFAEATIGRFAAEAAKVAQSTTKNFDEFSKIVRERVTELDARYAAKETELDARYQQKVTDLDTREAAHTENVKQFELRNNTAVRRDLLREIKSKIENQAVLKLSPGTSAKRWILHIVCGLTLLLSAGLAGAFVYKLFKAPTFDWHYLVPLTTGTLIFVSTVIFYIRWNDQWFRDHARAEMETRKFSGDILRASWLAELFFEWEQKRESEMPKELLTSFTRGLFDSPTFDGKLHPADQLHELLKEISSLKVDKEGGIEISKNKKG
jgi:hypothetical protein